MHTLHIKQINTGQADQYRVFVTWRHEDPAEPIEEATVDFSFRMSEAEQKDLHWYLEDYLEYPLDPNPQIAARIEARMAELGRQLFSDVFESAAARDLWAVLRRNLNQTRVEIAVEDVRQATAVPWELLRDPRTDVPLALRAAAFVRTYAQPAQRAARVQTGEAGEQTRILFVICRPGGREDVPFRSVAGRLVKGLSKEDRRQFQLDVLRPPTFARLSEVLRQASEDGKPYHILHFDGHGAYVEGPDQVPFVPGRHTFKGIQAGSHGYLLFEDPQQEDNSEYVHGVRLGDLMVETNTPVLVLNACRSAHAETDAEPGEDEAGDPLTAGGPGAEEERPARAFGSLAQEVMDSGVAGIVAMRYNVYVVTAAQFVADLYAALERGQTLGAAVSAGRKQLHADPQRTIAYDPIDLQDWLVPIVYESAPIRLFPQQEESAGTLILDPQLATRQSPLSSLPAPDTEFIGRDETLLALDRAFDRHPIVLLEAYAGSGKTMTAAEFARWYSQTGGIKGPVLFTSFEQPQALPQVLDTLGQVFESLLAQNNVNWLALDDDGRRQVVLAILAQFPVLWIWDNVEPVAGFPRPQDASLSAAQQQELAGFLRAARGTQAKFLLTSRREERGWLGDLPRRIHIPPMPMQERGQLARALADKQGISFMQVKDWRPLLKFTQGNPLTITSLVGQALRRGLSSFKEIVRFVEELRQGETLISDEKAQGRAKSLAASLSYGFDHAFEERERAQLALLHFFQGFVDVDVLRWMGDPNDDWSLPILHGISSDELKALLNRAADSGLLTPLGGRDSGYYSIHPALPWFFQAMFAQYYPDQSPAGSEQAPATLAARAFVEALGQLGNYYHSQYGDGNRDVIAALEMEEANLLQARALARRHGWFSRVPSTMQGLRTLYGQTGRRAAWRRLVEEIAPDFVDPGNDGPLPGREEQWGLVTEYRVLLAEEVRDWAEAERVQRIRVEWNRRRAAPFLPDPEGPDQHNTVRTLAVSLEGLGHILREQSKAACIAHYEEALDLSERIGEQAVAANCAFNLGHAYKDLPDSRDLAQAEKWYRRSLELRAEGDHLGQGNSYSQLGFVAYERFGEARAAGKGGRGAAGISEHGRYSLPQSAKAAAGQRRQ